MVPTSRHLGTDPVLYISCQRNRVCGTNLNRRCEHPVQAPIITRMSLRSFRTLLFTVLALALFASSFALPAILFRRMSHGPGGRLWPAGLVVKTGKTMALGSLLGPLFGNFAVAANPLLFVGCILMLRRKTKAAIVCLGLAVLLALQTFQLMVLPYHEDEGGVLVSFMVRPLVGWYCWFGAMLLAFFLALEQRWLSRQLPVPAVAISSNESA